MSLSQDLGPPSMHSGAIHGILPPMRCENVYISSSPRTVDRPKSARRGSPQSENKIFSCEALALISFIQRRKGRENAHRFEVPVDYWWAARVEVIKPFCDAEELGREMNRK